MCFRQNFNLGSGLSAEELFSKNSLSWGGNSTIVTCFQISQGWNLLSQNVFHLSWRWAIQFIESTANLLLQWKSKSVLCSISKFLDLCRWHPTSQARDQFKPCQLELNHTGPSKNWFKRIRTAGAGCYMVRQPIFKPLMLLGMVVWQNTIGFQMTSWFKYNFKIAFKIIWSLVRPELRSW